MKTLLVLSDTHGNLESVSKLVTIMKESDFVIHLGDNCRDVEPFQREITGECFYVKGNCDGGGGETFFQVESLKILVCHGHEYGVKSSLTRLYLHAKELGANVVFYGHTHIAKIEDYNGISFINPGSMQRFSQQSYCYAVVNGDKIVAKIVKMY